MSTPAERITLAAAPARAGGRRHTVRDLIDSDTVVGRQMVLAGIYAVAQLMFLVPTVQAHDPGQVTAASLLMALTTLAALLLPWERYAPAVTMVLPLLDIIAVGFLRSGTGGPASVFGSLWILCAISLGAEPGRLPVLLGLPFTVVLTLLPVINGGLVGAEWVRAIFLPLVLFLTGLLVNELTGRLRGRLDTVDDLRRRQSDLLAQARAHASAYSASSALLRESTAQMGSVIDAVTEQSIIGTDLTGRIDVFNKGAEKLLGHRASDVIGRAFITDFHLLSEVEHVDAPSSALDPEDNRPAEPHHLEILAANPRRGVPEVREWRKLRADGTTVPTQVAVTARRDAEGQLVGFLFVATDMTAALEQARLKDEFINLISHELRTPLSSILGYIELIADDPDHPLSDEQRRYLNTVERNANRLLRLVSDLLFTAQVESGVFTITEQAVDVQALVQASLDTAQPAAAARSVTLDVVDAGAPVILRGDPIRLSQAVDNLLSNAVKFTRPGGSVTVSVSREAGQVQLAPGRPPGPAVCIAVRDTGIGIPEDELDRLFSRFFRASTARTESVPGVGLGLTIAKAIATAHGGTIELTSKVGCGTTFTIRLPDPAAPESVRMPKLVPSVPAHVEGAHGGRTAGGVRTVV